MRQRLRVFVSSPGDVSAAREIAAQVVERVAQSYARFFVIEPYLWEHEPMLASGHFQDSIDPPSAFDVVVLILWSRLGTPLPERTALREYRGIDGRAPITGTEWEFEDALQASRRRGVPDLLVYRSREPATIDTWDPVQCDEQLKQLKALDRFWSSHFATAQSFIAAYSKFKTREEFATGFERDLRRSVEKRIAALAPGQRDKTERLWHHAPFRGLESYEFEHAPIYFGQDEFVGRAMLQLIANAEGGNAFLLVLGASGSGKSSLVKAGILPKLFVPRRVSPLAFLRHVVFRPSDTQEDEDLFDALARRLTTRIGDFEGLPELVGPQVSVEDLAAHLRGATAEPAMPFRTALGHLASIARHEGRMLDFESARLVLVVDQLEELFTAERIGTRERGDFVNLLAALARSGVAWIVATMRSDFWHRATDTPELVRLSENAGRIDLLPASQAQLSQMIRRPADAAGVTFEINGTTDIPLSDVITDEVAREPGALPLLSYLLDQLYRSDVIEAGNRVLSYATYERLGGLRGAIANRADTILAECATEIRQTLASVLFLLVQMGTLEGNVERAIARRVPISAFPTGTPQRRLVETLLDPDVRLLVSESEEGASPTVRIAHEALISHWEKARDFVQGNAQALRTRRRIEDRYTQWRALTDHKESIQTRRGIFPSNWRTKFDRQKGLLRDLDLIEGRRLLREHATELEPEIASYIVRSIADDRRMRTRSIRILSGAAITMLILAVGATFAAWMALAKSKEAEQQREQALEAQERSLSQTAAVRLKQGDVSGSMAIALSVLARQNANRLVDPTLISDFQEARANDRQLIVLIGHGSAIYSAAISPNGTRAVTASRDKTARIWDIGTGVQLAVLSGHSLAVRSAQWSPDGTRIVTASKDKTARIWDAFNGRELGILSGSTGGVESANWSPNGKLIVTASDDKVARIWDAETYRQIAVLRGHTDQVRYAMFSPDGRRVVTASNDKTARIWDAKAGRQIAVLIGHTDNLVTAAYSPDGKYIVTASDDRTARMWDATRARQLSVLYGHTQSVISANWSPDGMHIITASLDKTARIWDAATGIQLSMLAGHGGYVMWGAYSPDNKRIITGSYDKTARIWDTDDSAFLAKLSGHSKALESAMYSPDSRRILTASDDKTARVWDANSGAQLQLLDGHAAEVDFAAWSPDGKQIVTASQDKTARVWDAANGTHRLTLSGHTGVVSDARWSPDSKLIVTSGYDNTARVWDAVSGTQRRVLAGHKDDVQTATWSPDGKRIVTASKDTTARVWNAASGSPLMVLAGHLDAVESAAWSPDGKSIVTASDDGTARIWNSSSGVQRAILYGHAGTVLSASWSPDGKYIVTASLDKTARIWDAKAGDQLAVLPGHTEFVATADYSPDGERIVTASGDNTARIWNAQVEALPVQIEWADAAQIDMLSNKDRYQIGLPPPEDILEWGKDQTECDEAAAAPYDPDRRSAGVTLDKIVVYIALLACTAETSKHKTQPRDNYQLGRVLLAEDDVSGAKREFERAAAEGYRAAAIDLGDLFSEPTYKLINRTHAALFYQEAAKNGVAIANCRLGRLYEHDAKKSSQQLREAWWWYRKGADLGEPNALGRFGEQDDEGAVAAKNEKARDSKLLDAFRYYAAAAERARQEDWPDEAWQNWRYRRASIARILARDGMMQQVADSYEAVLKKWAAKPRTPPND